jgi:CheY-like chemotaxis protein
MTKEILLIDDDADELEVFSEALRSVDKTSNAATQGSERGS